MRRISELQQLWLVPNN